MVFSCNLTHPFFTCSQRAWLLKLLAVGLHAGDMTNTNYRETCQSILAHMFGQHSNEYSLDHSMSQSISHNHSEGAGNRTVTRSKVILLIIDPLLLIYMVRPFVHMFDSKFRT